MQYLLMIYANEKAEANMNEGERGELFAAYMKYTEDLKQAGAFVAGDALQPVSTATSVRVRNGDKITTDGPFAETKEQLGGYYLIEAKDLDAATQWAAKIPSAKYGTIEVRPLMVFE
jgi:hypothetical protein